LYFVLFKQLFVGYKHGEKDSILEIKNNHIPNHIHFNNLSLSQDELQFIIDNNFAYSPEVIEKILVIFKDYRIYFFVLLIIECIVNISFSYLTWSIRSKSLFIVSFWLKQMEEIYNDLNSLEAYVLFYSIFFVNLALNLVFYPLGFYSMIRKNVKYLKFFSKIALISTIAMVFMTYLSLYDNFNLDYIVLLLP